MNEKTIRNIFREELRAETLDILAAQVESKCTTKEFKAAAHISHIYYLLSGDLFFCRKTLDEEMLTNQNILADYLVNHANLLKDIDKLEESNKLEDVNTSDKKETKSSDE